METCRSCRFFRPPQTVNGEPRKPDYQLGFCVRYAPRPRTEQVHQDFPETHNPQFRGWWPMTHRDDTCGDWAPVDPPPARIEADPDWMDEHR